MTLSHDTSKVAEEPNSTGKPHKYISRGYSQERDSGRNDSNAETHGMKELGISFQVEGKASAGSHGDMFERQTWWPWHKQAEEWDDGRKGRLIH